MARAHPARLILRCWLAVLLLAGLQAASAQERFAFAGGWLQFATVDEGRAELTRADDYTETAGDFQRASVLGVAHAPDRDSFRAALAKSAQAWTPQQVARWRAAAAHIEPAFVSLRVRLPETVLLVSTDGSDSGGTPHTRGRAVFLPAQFRVYLGDGELLAHELFHVLTRHQPELASRIYALFGYEPVAPLEWPREWAAQRIANPDAPHHRHVMWLQAGERRFAVMPVPVAWRATMPGEPIFRVLELRLLAVEPGRDGQPTRALMHESGPVWKAPEAVPEFQRRLGGNTSYILHPEETAADNFAYLVSGRAVPNPQLLARLRAVLQSAATSPSPSLSSR